MPNLNNRNRRVEKRKGSCTPASKLWKSEGAGYMTGPEDEENVLGCLRCNGP